MTLKILSQKEWSVPVGVDPNQVASGRRFEAESDPATPELCDGVAHEMDEMMHLRMVAG